MSFHFVAAVTVHSDFGAQEAKISLFQVTSRGLKALLVFTLPSLCYSCQTYYIYTHGNVNHTIVSFAFSCHTYFMERKIVFIGADIYHI